MGMEHIRTMDNVCDCVIVRDDSVLLLWKIKPEHYVFPGGKVDPAESLEVTAMREAKEEIGCDIWIMKYLGGVSFQYNGKIFHAHQYLAKIPPGHEPVAKEPDVFDHLIWMPLGDYPKYSLDERVREFCEDVREGKLIL